MLLLLAAAVAVGAYLYPALPAQVASHWNIHGEVDGYMGKVWGVITVPLIMFFIILTWWVIPHLDPLKRNLDEFLPSYNMFFISLEAFFLYVYGLTIVWNLGNHFNLAQFLTPGLALLMASVGVVLLNSKRNWFIGIRTPWTLSSDSVWEKTHKLGAILFEISALVMLFGILLPDYLLPIIFVPIALSAVVTIFYSYIEFKKEKR
jgi:uncharacterized membrane protein